MGGVHVISDASRRYVPEAGHTGRNGNPIFWCHPTASPSRRRLCGKNARGKSPRLHDRIKYRAGKSQGKRAEPDILALCRGTRHPTASRKPAGGRRRAWAPGTCRRGRCECMRERGQESKKHGLCPFSPGKGRSPCIPSNSFAHEESRGGSGRAMLGGVPSARDTPAAAAGGWIAATQRNLVPMFSPSSIPTRRRGKQCCGDLASKRGGRVISHVHRDATMDGRTRVRGRPYGESGLSFCGVMLVNMPPPFWCSESIGTPCKLWAAGVAGPLAGHGDIDLPALRYAFDTRSRYRSQRSVTSKRGKPTAIVPGFADAGAIKQADRIFTVAAT